MAAAPPTAPPTMAPVGVELPVFSTVGVGVTTLVVGFIVTVAKVVEVGVAVAAVIGTDHLSLLSKSRMGKNTFPK